MRSYAGPTALQLSSYTQGNGHFRIVHRVLAVRVESGIVIGQLVPGSEYVYDAITKRNNQSQKEPPNLGEIIYLPANRYCCETNQ